MAFNRVSHQTDLENQEFSSLVLLNEKARLDLVNSYGLKLLPYKPDAAASETESELLAEVRSEFGLNGDANIKLWQPDLDQLVIGVSGSSLFERAEHPLVAVVPNISGSLRDSSLMTYATTGSVMFIDGAEVVAKASDFGINVTVDSIKVATIMRAEDLRLGWQISLLSLVLALAAFLVMVFTSASIYAQRKQRSILPSYLNGCSWTKLLRGSIVLDALVVLLGCAAAVALGIALQVNYYWLALLVGFVIFGFIATVRRSHLGAGFIRVIRREEGN